VRFRFGPFTLDPASRQLLRSVQPVHLSPKAFDVLRVLLERWPAAVSKTELIDLVWQGTFVADASLTMVIAEIRRVLGDEAQDPHFVRTVHRFGYAFCTDVHDGDSGAGGEPAPSEGPTAWLVWSGRALVLRDGENIVGRDPRCDVWLDAAGVSRRHARIHVARGAATIEDLGSKNGTSLRDTPVTGAAPLCDGDIIQLGPVDAQFRLGSERGSTETVRQMRR
jgi:DNA-binding winged helix-turn-helix (wHTH) protein